MTLVQSRYANAAKVKELFLETYGAYVNSTEKGVFGSTFNGYLRTRYVERQRLEMRIRLP